MTSEKKFLFVGNGPYANRGCEAIAKATIGLLRGEYPGCAITNGNQAAAYDRADETEEGVTHQHCAYFAGRDSGIGVSTLVFEKSGLLPDLSAAGRFVRREAPACDAVLSLGGDLYGLSMGKQTLAHYYLFGKAAVNTGKPFIIWCATIGYMEREPKLKRMLMDHFRKCSLLLVRDEHSLHYLDQCGVRDNVKLVADPAFLLIPAPPSFPLRLREPLAESIGFNMAAAYGPLARIGGIREMVGFSADCVAEVMRRTKRPVILVPHVIGMPPDMCPDSDTLFLSLVREALACRGIDVDLLPSCLRSWELKWVLGQVKAYVGAKFHSTVASFGSGTPTALVSYSEKGPALSQFVTGSAEYAVDCRAMSVDKIAETACGLVSEGNAIRASILRRLPDIQRLAASSVVHLRRILESDKKA